MRVSSPNVHPFISAAYYVVVVDAGPFRVRAYTYHVYMYIEFRTWEEIRPAGGILREARLGHRIPFLCQARRRGEHDEEVRGVLLRCPLVRGVLGALLHPQSESWLWFVRHTRGSHTVLCIDYPWYCTYFCTHLTPGVQYSRTSAVMRVYGYYTTNGSWI